MDPATLTILVRLAAELGGSVIRLLRAAGQERTAAELEASLRAVNADAQTIIDRARQELDLPPVVPTPEPAVEPGPDPGHDVPEPPPAPPAITDPTDARLAVVQTVRARYGETISAEQGVMICNEVAFRLNGDRPNGYMGLQRSVPGDLKSHLGFSPCHVTDYTTGTVYVVLETVPGAGRPRWAVATTLTPAWMAAKPSWVPVGPTSPTGPAADPSALEARLTALDARVRVLEEARRAGGS